MAPAKRKAPGRADTIVPAPAKRQKNAAETTASSSRPSRTSLAATAPAPRSTRSSLSGTSSTVKKAVGLPRKSVKTTSTLANGTPKKTISTKTTRGRKNAAQSTHDEDETSKTTRISVDVPQSKNGVSDTKADHDRELQEHGDGPSYWLMKAEPDSRIEKGKDVKFSIDDLKAVTAPEGWDGVRNYVARNNMRLMMKGDFAFFYHSNCKVPGIVGWMEIVQEHSVDETAFDSEHPYYDDKSDREKPKWCLVHVEFRQKFPDVIKLKELQKYSMDGGVLEHMQVLKQSRLSVSKVTKKEWDFIMGLIDVEDVGAASAQHRPQMVG